MFIRGEWNSARGEVKYQRTTAGWHITNHNDSARAIMFINTQIWHMLHDDRGVHLSSPTRSSRSRTRDTVAMLLVWSVWSPVVKSHANEERWQLARAGTIILSLSGRKYSVLRASIRRYTPFTIWSILYPTRISLSKFASTSWRLKVPSPVDVSCCASMAHIFCAFYVLTYWRWNYTQCDI